MKNKSDKLIARGALFLQNYPLLFHKTKGQKMYQVLSNTIKNLTSLTFFNRINLVLEREKGLIGLETEGCSL